MNKFEKEIHKLFEAEKLSEALIEIPPKPEFGDYAVPCFSYAKTMKKAPNAIAQELSNKFKSTLFEKIINVGPYVNFYCNKSEFAEILKKIDTNFGKGEKKKENVMVEYCQVNTHKAFHVGHLRGTLLGASVINILKFLGYNVISANYQGDIGAHVAKSIWYLTKHYKGKYPKENKGIWLGQIYQKANAMLEKNKDYKLEVSEILQKLESGDKELTELWKKTRQWSLDDFEEFYKMIGVSFDKYFFESQMEKPGKLLVNKLLNKNIAKKSDGAIIVDLEKYNLGISIILKSDGTALYSTKDLALASDKFDKYNINRSIYVVGSEQSFYFKQIFKILELMGFKDAKNCYHLPYGLVMLESGKISSREGELILASELMNTLFLSASKEVKLRHNDWTDKEIKESANKIALAAVKFTMINQDSNKPIIFNTNKALDFEGETGPYIQYAHARICSIIKKHDKKINKQIDYSLFNDAEHSIIKLLEKFPKIMIEAGENYKPQLLVRYTLDLAQMFNEYYHANPILKAEDNIRDARLYLIDKVRIVIESGLNLLGIDAPKQM